MRHKGCSLQGEAHTMSSVHVYDLSVVINAWPGLRTCELVDDVVVYVSLGVVRTTLRSTTQHQSFFSRRSSVSVFYTYINTII